MFDRDYAERRDAILADGSIVYTHLSGLFFERATCHETSGELEKARQERWCGELLMAYSVHDDGGFGLRDLTILNPAGPWGQAPIACYELCLRIGTDPGEPAEIRAAFLHGLWDTRTIWRALNPGLVALGDLVEQTILAHLDAAEAYRARLDNVHVAMAVVDHYRTAVRLAQATKQLTKIKSRLERLHVAVSEVMVVDPGWAMRLIEVEIDLAAQRGHRDDQMVPDARLASLRNVLSTIDAAFAPHASKQFLRHQALKAQVAVETLLGTAPSEKEVAHRRARICVDTARLETSALMQADAWRYAAQQFEAAGLPQEAADAKRQSRDAAHRAVETEFVEATFDLKLDRSKYEAQLAACLEGGSTRVILLRLGMNLFAPNLEVEHHPPSDEPPSLTAMLSTIPIVGNRLQDSIAAGSEEAAAARLNELFAMDIDLHNSLFLVPIFEHLVTELHVSAVELVSFLSLSNAVTEDELVLAFVGMRAFLRGDLVSAMHLLVPRLEHLVRSHLGRAGADTTAFEFGSMKERTFGTLLAEGRSAGVLPIGIYRLLRRVLTDDNGFNLRNKIAHGLASTADCSPNNACRVVQMMLFVAALGFRLPERVERATGIGIAQS